MRSKTKQISRLNELRHVWPSSERTPCHVQQQTVTPCWTYHINSCLLCLPPPFPQADDPRSGDKLELLVHLLRGHVPLYRWCGNERSIVLSRDFLHAGHDGDAWSVVREVVTTCRLIPTSLHLAYSLRLLLMAPRLC